MTQKKLILQHILTRFFQDLASQCIILADVLQDPAKNNESYKFLAGNEFLSIIL